jgi:hypothetical protein
MRNTRQRRSSARADVPDIGGMDDVSLCAVDRFEVDLAAVQLHGTTRVPRRLDHCRRSFVDWFKLDCPSLPTGGYTTDRSASVHRALGCIHAPCVHPDGPPAIELC